jgi:glucose-1-phosphate adenylyltransferase
MKAVGIILAGGNNSRMQELSNKRAIAAMPIGGSFRSIDFALSNMSNSHVHTVAVLTQYSARSLNEHLSSSKWWDFGRKQGGLYVFNPTVTVDNSWWYRGTADAMYQNIDFLQNQLYNFYPLLSFHYMHYTYLQTQLQVLKKNLVKLPFADIPHILIQ